MPWFEYRGLTPGGTDICGRLEAADVEEAREELARMRIDAREVTRTKPEEHYRAGLSTDDLIFFNGQLASLAQAGIALDEGLAQLARDVQSSRLRTWLEGLVEDLRGGMAIDAAIARRESGLPLLYSRVIRAGIESGDLPATLLNLNQHLRLAGNTRRLVWEAASYPLLVAVLALSVISLVFSLIVPKFREIYTDFGATLPGLTVLLLDVSDWFARGGWALVWLTPLALVLAWESLRYVNGGLALQERIKMELPIIGRIHSASVLARFLRAAATAVATGIPLPQAMRLSAAATGSRILERDAERVAAEVERGESVFAASQSTRVIPPLFGFCVQVATGRDALPQALGQLAHAYEHRAENMQSLIKVMLLPGLVIILGGFVGLVIIATFLPLIQLINSVSAI